VAGKGPAGRPPPARCDDDAWVAELGPALLSFVEEAATGGVRERRVLFADGNDADITVLPLTDLERVLARPDVASVFARGFRVLVDKDVLTDLPTQGSPPPEDYAVLVHEFWYRAILTARKLRRGELHVAVQSCNCGLRNPAAARPGTRVRTPSDREPRRPAARTARARHADPEPWFRAGAKPKDAIKAWEPRLSGSSPIRSIPER
jgi:streptomycin adenylyltransferase